MKIQISQSSIKKIDILNKVVNAWVTTTNYERENFPHSYFIALSKAFPEAVYKDIAYRRVTIDPSFIEKLHDSLYVDYKKTDADLKELENFKSDNPQEMYETQSLLFEWDRLKVKALVPNGRAMWWKALHRYIQQNSSGRYVSWSASMKGIDRFQKIVNFANRARPIQFEDMPISESLTIKQRVKGFALYKVTHLINDKSKAKELVETEEVVAPMTSFVICEEHDKDSAYKLATKLYEPEY